MPHLFELLKGDLAVVLRELAEQFEAEEHKCEAFETYFILVCKHGFEGVQVQDLGKDTV